MALMLQQMAEALVKTADLIEEADREAAGFFDLDLTRQVGTKPVQMQQLMGLNSTKINTALMPPPSPLATQNSSDDDWGEELASFTLTPSEVSMLGNLLSEAADNLQELIENYQWAGIVILGAGLFVSVSSFIVTIAAAICPADGPVGESIGAILTAFGLGVTALGLGISLSGFGLITIPTQVLRDHMDDLQDIARYLKTAGGGGVGCDVQFFGQPHGSIIVVITPDTCRLSSVR